MEVDTEKDFSLGTEWTAEGEATYGDRSAAIGGRGRLYGAAIGAVFVSLVSTWFTGGQAPIFGRPQLHTHV